MPSEASPEKPEVSATEITLATVAKLRGTASVEAAIELQELGELSEKAIAKAARRALYELKLKGIEPPERVFVPAPPAALKPEEILASRAWITGYGGTGSRMLLFLRDDPHGGSPFLLTFLVNNDEGVSDLGGRKLARKQIEEKIAELGAKEGTVLAEAPIDYARRLLQQAAARNVETRSPIPEGYSNWSQYVGEPQGAYARSPVYDVIDADAVRNNLGISHNPETFFEQQPFVGWMLNLREVNPWEEKFFESQQSQIVLDKSQVAERGERIIDEATDALMGGDRIRDFRTRLEETAYVLHLQGREDQAKETLYHALGLRDDVQSHSQPFARALVKRSIFVVIALKAEEEDENTESEPDGLIQRV